MGLYPNGSDFSEPLGIGVILPSFQSAGKMPVEIDILKSLCSEWAMLIEVNLSILAETPSVLVDLVTSS